MGDKAEKKKEYAFLPKIRKSTVIKSGEEEGRQKKRASIRAAGEKGFCKGGLNRGLT